MTSAPSGRKRTTASPMRTPCAVSTLLFNRSKAGDDALLSSDAIDSELIKSHISQSGVKVDFSYKTLR